MNSQTPKQFISINGKPILMHAITPFLEYAHDIEICLVLPENLISQWKELCNKHKFHHKHLIIPGGPARFYSVKNGLNYVPDHCIVAIHDGVRPLVGVETIARVFDHAEKFGNAIPVVDINESVRAVEGAGSRPCDRAKLKIVQTPQGFRSENIKAAYNQNYRECFLDDASVLESTGERIFLVEGNRENIKITLPGDIILAKALLKK